jgi:hypothetical protein
VYDPRIGRFVSADPIVQSPTHSQSYNRYSYVFNSPLSYTDPSGFGAFTDRERQEAMRVMVMRQELEALQIAQTMARYNRVERNDPVGQYNNPPTGPVPGAPPGDPAPVPGAPPGQRPAPVPVFDGSGNGEHDGIYVFDPLELDDVFGDGLDTLPVLVILAAHDKGPRESTREKHEKGEAAKNKSRGGEKADKTSRGKPRIRPQHWKGPWPGKGHWPGSVPVVPLMICPVCPFIKDDSDVLGYEPEVASVQPSESVPTDDAKRAAQSMVVSEWGVATCGAKDHLDEFAWAEIGGTRNRASPFEVFATCSLKN